MSHLGLTSRKLSPEKNYDSIQLSFSIDLHSRVSSPRPSGGLCERVDLLSLHCINRKLHTSFFFLWKRSSTKMFLKNNLTCYAFFSILSGEGMLDVSQSSPQTRYKLGFYVFVLSFSPHLWELKMRGEKARKGRENKETGGERNKRFNLCKDLDIRKSSACVVFTRSGRK